MELMKNRYKLIEEHARYLNSQVIGLHLRVQESLKRRDDTGNKNY